MSSNDGHTIFLNSAGGTGHFYRLDTWSDTLTEDTSYGPIGFGTDVSTIMIDPRPWLADRPDTLARKGNNLYVTVRYSGQVARIKTQTGSVEYIDVAPAATSGYAVHGIAVRP